MRNKVSAAIVAILISGCAGPGASGPGANNAGSTRAGGEAQATSGGVQFQFIAAGQNGSADQALPHRADLTSGSKFGLRLVAEQPSYVYVWHRSAAQGATPEKLLPSAGAEATQTMPQSPVQLPAAGQWYELDNKVGDEVFFVIAAKSPLDPATLERMLAEIPTDRVPPSINPDNRGGGPTYNAVMNEAGVATLAYVLQHK